MNKELISINKSIMKVKYGKIDIEFKVSYRKRKTLKISVKPDLKVEVIVPKQLKEKSIKEVVFKRAPWILKQINYFKDISPIFIPKEYIDGEKHMYLGRRYILKIISSKKNHVELKKNYIYIYTIHKENAQYNKKLLYKGYRNCAKKVFKELFDVCYEKMKKYGIEKPTWSIRKMKARWGSYHPIKNHIVLNLELIRAFPSEIEYVIIHELCHAKHPNHSKDFYGFMDVAMKDWRERKKNLNKIII